MVEKNNKKIILIVGKSAKEHALARWFSMSQDVGKIYVAPGNVAIAEFAQCVDIREDDVQGLFEFAIKNEIDLTVASSVEAIEADIAGMFSANEQAIFAPEKDNAEFALSKSTAKKLLYRLRIPTAKFGIFDRANLATDYVKNGKMPLIISSDQESENSIRAVISTHKQAKTIISDLEVQNANKYIIEDYTYGHNFTLYVITDGVSALPVGIIGDYKFKENGDGGLYTLGAAAFSPDYKVSFALVGELMENVVNKILDEGNTRNRPYLGILGIECVLKQNGEYFLNNIIPFMKYHDTQTLLNQLDTDFLKLVFSCVNGAFSDEYIDIPIKDDATVSCVLFSRKENTVITGLDMIDEDTVVNHFGTTRNAYFEYLTNKGRTLVVTQTASTFTKAKELLYENIDEIHFDGKSFRGDIGKDNIQQ